MAVATSSSPSTGGTLSTGSKAPTGPNTSEEEEECGATTTAASSNSNNATNNNNNSDQEPSTIASSRRRHGRPPTPAEFLSDKATAALIRRTLCARQPADRERSSPAPIQDLLPPLTSRNDVDLQLYALISIVLREFVQNWYNKITPDETFVAEIVQVIAHCTRALEQRLRKVDLESLLFDELPELLIAHVRAFRAATSPATRPPLQTDTHQIYHSLHPLPALSPVPRAGDQASVQAQANNESLYRQLLVQGVLAVLLPTEDLENEGMTSLVGQILSELVIGDLVADKLSEPWLIWEILIMITKLIHEGNNSDNSDNSEPPLKKSATAQDSHTKTKSILEVKQPWSFGQIFWSFVHWIFLIVGMLRLITNVIALSWSLPPKSCHSLERLARETNQDTQEQEPEAMSYEFDVDAGTHATRVPIIDFHIWRCIGDILEVQARMPWLQGTLSMMQWVTLKGPGALDGTLDRLMSHYIRILVLDPAHMPELLRATRAALFPNNAPGTSTLKPPSSREELVVLRYRCASALLGLVPRTMAEVYYGTSISAWGDGKANTPINEDGDVRTRPLKSRSSSLDHNNATTRRNSSNGEGSSHMSHPGQGEHMISNDDATLSSQLGGRLGESRIISEIETGIVDIFSDAYCNKHLIYGVLELVLVRLVPELAERGVGELWEERMV